MCVAMIPFLSHIFQGFALIAFYHYHVAIVSKLVVCWLLMKEGIFVSWLVMLNCCIVVCHPVFLIER